MQITLHSGYCQRKNVGTNTHFQGHRAYIESI